MKNSLLALALAAATMPLTFGQAPAQNPPAANPPAATKSTTAKPKTKKPVKKSHVKKTKKTNSPTGNASRSASK